MKTITIDIIDNDAMKLLEDLELLNLIRLHNEKTESSTTVNTFEKYKGAITKQPLTEIETQLNQLRDE